MQNPLQFSDLTADSGQNLFLGRDRPTLWITGISGFLGWHLSQVAQYRWRIFGTYHRHPVEFTDPAIGTTAPLDLLDFAAVTATFEAQPPAAVIHTAAMSKPNQCQQQPQASQAINVAATEHLARCCAAAQIPLVFTSSNVVFDGQSPPYQESDPPCPVNLYGEQKAEAEQRLRAAYPAAIVCRLPLMFGPPAPAAGSFLQDFLDRLRSGTPLTLFTDEIRMPADARSIATGLLLALAHPGTQTLHLAGADALSRYQMGQLIADIWQIDHAHLRPCRQADMPMPAPRPPDLSMNISRAQKLGFQPVSMRTALEAIRTTETGENRRELT
ncbi:MAG: NAD(P)-dependent oxidoreductase [Cyanobacteria bacterium J06648_16]